MTKQTFTLLAVTVKDGVATTEVEEFEADIINGETKRSPNSLGPFSQEAILIVGEPYYKAPQFERAFRIQYEEFPESKDLLRVSQEASFLSNTAVNTKDAQNVQAYRIYKTTKDRLDIDWLHKIMALDLDEAVRRKMILIDEDMERLQARRDKKIERFDKAKFELSQLVRDLYTHKEEETK